MVLDSDGAADAVVAADGPILVEGGGALMHVSHLLHSTYHEVMRSEIFQDGDLWQVKNGTYLDAGLIDALCLVYVVRVAVGGN